MIVPPGGSAWIAPSPEALPDLRIEMSDQMTAHPHNREFWRRMVGGSFPLIPTAPSPEEQAAAYELGGTVMARSEQRRLREAQLYWVDEDMTSLALAAAATPPQEPVKASRMPAEAGLMLFAQPIGACDYDVSTAVTAPPYVAVPNLDDDLVLTMPIVAVSWSTWRPAHLELDTQPGKLHWSPWHPQAGLPTPLLDDFEGVWLTFWTTSALGWDTLPPDKPVTTNPQTGHTLIAKDMAAREANAGYKRLKTYDERVLPFNQPLLLLGERDTSSEWAQIVYTAWQLMSQTGSAQLTETQKVPRRRAGLRRDTRANIPHPWHCERGPSPHPPPPLTRRPRRGRRNLPRPTRTKLDPPMASPSLPP